MVSLELQSRLKLEWGKEQYIGKVSKVSKLGLAWIRLGAWRMIKITDENGMRVCPLCKGEESWFHILANCEGLENWREKYLPLSFMESNREQRECLELLTGKYVEEGIGKFLIKARQLRFEKATDWRAGEE